MKNRMLPNFLILLTCSLIAGAAAAQSPAGSGIVSPYDFPYGYPYATYPLGGGSLGSGYLREEPDPERVNLRKRIGRYALRLIQTGRFDEAVDFADRYLRNRSPGDMEQEVMLMRAVALGHLGRLDEAVDSIKRAIEEFGIPPQRVLAGPRRLFGPLREHPAFIALWERWGHDLVHGPMLGAMTDAGAKVWVRTADETPVRVTVSRWDDPGDVRIAGPVISRAGSDYTAVIPINGLEPDTRYRYTILLGEERRPIRAEHQQFRTYPAPGRSAQFQVAFGGCAGYVPMNERMWDTIREYDPLALLTLGDNIYIDDPESPDQQQLLYYQRQSRPEFRRLVGSRPVYAIWDDHDFGMNDSWGGPEIGVPYWKPMVLEIFRQNWVNPSYGGGHYKPGVWFDFRIADVHFIMLDGRYYREDSGRFGGDGVTNPSMLGPVQMAWLKQTLLDSDAAFRVLVSPVPWHEEAKTGAAGLDTWAGYLEEREEIFSWIRDHRVPGVVLLSSDRHRSDAWLNERVDSYDLYEFASGQFTNLHTHALEPGALFGYNDLPSFGLLKFDTTAGDPTVTYQIINIDGEVQHTLTINRSKLTN